MIDLMAGPDASMLKSSLHEEGYAIVPFPKTITVQLQQYILKFISKLNLVNFQSSTNFSTINSDILRMDDARFYGSMHHAFRYFPSQLAKSVINWVIANLDDIFNASQIGTHQISPVHLQLNPKLGAQSHSFYFRFVRPNKDDIAYAHVDKHYWELSQGNEHATFPNFSYTERWKLWIPFLGCHSQNMLQVVPASHESEVPFDLKFIAGEIKPSIQSSWLAANSKNFVCPLKQNQETALLMHDALVHRGPRNPGPLSRVSAELTIFTSKL